MFERLYATILQWARHRHAERYLTLMAFTGSSFFPLPVEMMLAPMVFARPEKAVYLGLLTAIASVLGGILGYALGYYAIDLIMPWINAAGHGPLFAHILEWFERWGFWVVFAAGFAPLPYKVFTIAAGALAFSLPAFVLASMLSRIARFVLMARLFALLGPHMQRLASRYMEWAGWATIATLVGLIALRS